jgi:hypothetical protein
MKFYDEFHAQIPATSWSRRWQPRLIDHLFTDCCSYFRPLVLFCADRDDVAVNEAHSRRGGSKDGLGRRDSTLLKLQPARVADCGGLQ